jgi:uncharacterized protein
MEFEWDAIKAERNWRDHGVAFEDAANVFDDNLALLEDDPYPYEYRQRAIGMVGNDLLFVVFTMRNDICRLISARLAERSERRRYHE